MQLSKYQVSELNNTDHKKTSGGSFGPMLAGLRIWITFGMDPYKNNDYYNA